MTLSPVDIYFINEADQVIGFFYVLSCGMVLLFILTLISMFLSVDDDKKIEKNVKIACMVGFFGFIIFLLIGSIIPSTKTLYEMLIIPKVVNSQVAQNMPVYIQQYIEKELKNGNP